MDGGHVLYWFLKHLVVGPVLHLFFRIRVEGLEHLPRQGAFIMASNHLAAIDSFFVPIALPRRLTYLAKAAYFQGKGPVGWFLRNFLLAVGQIPIDRSGGAASSAEASPSGRAHPPGLARAANSARSPPPAPPPSNSGG